MNRKKIMFGVAFLGILFLTAILTNSVANDEEGTGEEEPVDPEQPVEEEPDKPDEDEDGVDDNYEEENKRDIEIWIGENVVEMGSIRRHGDQKDIIDMRVGFGAEGISVRVSFGTIIRNPECDEPKEEPPSEGEEGELQWVNDCEIIQYKLKFDVFFRGLIEFVDLNDNDVLDFEVDEVIEDYGFSSFHPVDYSLISISDDSNLHYILLNTTDGVFAAHIYFVEEFVYVDETLISPTQVKIDIEISNYNYIDPNSQLALHTKLWSETIGYEEKEETEDENEGYASDEKEVYIHNDAYMGIFSWKETALIDGVEMPVSTKRIIEGGEHEYFEKLYICYPRGNHIYHDPKIGIYINIAQAPNFLIPIIMTSGIASVIGISAIAFITMKKRRII
ncbi:MAG: hypothetical protein ACXAB8_01825 [Promethearchaeota archaeon]|jgi:hypothetical protein